MRHAPLALVLPLLLCCGPKPAKVQIDFDNISQRILALPIPARNYQSLAAMSCQN